MLGDADMGRDEESDSHFLVRPCDEMRVFCFFDQRGGAEERILFADQVTGYRTRDCSVCTSELMSPRWEDRQQLCPSGQGGVGYDFLVDASDESAVSTTRVVHSIRPQAHRVERIPHNATRVAC